MCPGEIIRGLDPSEDSHHVLCYDPEGTVVAEGHVLDASTCRDRIAAAASRRSSRRPLLTSPDSRRSITGSGTVRRTTRGQRQRVRHGLYLAGAAGKVGEDEEPDPARR